MKNTSFSSNGRVSGNVETAMRHGIREPIQQRKVKREKGKVVLMGN